MQTDLAETEHDIPIPQNENVLAYVELFQGRLRPFIQEGLDRGSQYLPMIQSVFRAEGLPLDLAYVPLIESAFKPNALSRAERTRRLAVRARDGPRERPASRLVHRRALRPEKATHAAAKYLKTLSRACSTATGTSRWRLTTAARAASSAR